MYFEGERNAEYRVLRAVKNRFGNTNEIGIFEMRENGLVDVPDASKMFLSEQNDNTSGTVIIPALEGDTPPTCRNSITRSANALCATSAEHLTPSI